jgi:hypothetical protein
LPPQNTLRFAWKVIVNIDELSSEEQMVFRELIEVLEAFTADERLMIGATTRWSAKDVLAHLLAWEVAALDELATIRGGTWQPRRITKEEVDVINDAQVAAGSTRTFESLIDEFRKTRGELRKVYSNMMAESEDSEPLHRVIRSHCLHHCGRHLTQMNAWQRSLRLTPARKGHCEA